MIDWWWLLVELAVFVWAAIFIRRFARRAGMIDALDNPYAARQELAHAAGQRAGSR